MAAKTSVRGKGNLRHERRGRPEITDVPVTELIPCVVFQWLAHQPDFVVKQLAITGIENHEPKPARRGNSDREQHAQFLPRIRLKQKGSAHEREGGLFGSCGSTRHDFR